MARPTKFNKQIATEICARIAEGESLTTITKDDNFPSKVSVYAWLHKANEQDAPSELKDFLNQYTQARKCQAEGFVDQILDIAHDGSNDWMENNDPDNPGYKWNGESYQRSRLRIDTIKWVACKVLPKVYGDKVIQEISGPDGEPIKTQTLAPLVDTPQPETYEEWAARKQKELEALQDVN